jgi:cholesterol transport system auxiliary component
MKFAIRSCAPALAWRLPALALFVAGCTALQPAQVESPNLHLLEAGSPVRVARERRDLVLEVAAPRAWPGFDTPQMAYVRKPYELDYFADNRWVDAPARMLGPLLVHALEQSGGFRAVVQSPAAVPADLRVNSELIRLQQNFAMQPSRVELSLRVQLVDVRGKRVLGTRTFDESENAPSDDAYGGATAANVALQRVLGQAVDFCIAESGRRAGSVP